MLDLKSYLRDHAEVRARGETEWTIKCDCDDDLGEGHLYVNIEKHKGFCFRCRRTLSGDAEIIRFLTGCSLLEAIAFVRDSTTSTARLRQAVDALLPGEEEKVEPETSVELPDEFIQCSSRKAGPSYLRERGVTEKQCRDYGIGWCESGFYAHRVIVPVYDTYDTLVSFVARWAGDPPKGARKILYPKGSKISRVLFNEKRAAGFSTVVVVEGVFDAFRVGARAVALFGKHASAYQISRLAGLGMDRRIVVMLDPDARADAEDLAEELAELCPDVRIATLPKGKKDPGECSKIELRRAQVNAEQFSLPGRSLANLGL